MSVLLRMFKNVVWIESLPMLLAENPAQGIEAIPSTPLSPHSLSDQAVDALLRAVRNENEARRRICDGGGRGDTLL